MTAAPTHQVPIIVPLISPRQRSLSRRFPPACCFAGLLRRAGVACRVPVPRLWRRAEHGGRDSVAPRRRHPRQLKGTGARKSAGWCWQHTATTIAPPAQTFWSLSPACRRFQRRPRCRPAARPALRHPTHPHILADPSRPVPLLGRRRRRPRPAPRVQPLPPGCEPGPRRPPPSSLITVDLLRLLRRIAPTRGGSCGGGVSSRRARLSSSSRSSRGRNWRGRDGVLVLQQAELCGLLQQQQAAEAGGAGGGAGERGRCWRQQQAADVWWRHPA